MSAMTVAELNWVAGLLEGEGTFTTNGSTLVVALGMTDGDVVQKLATTLGHGEVRCYPPLPGRQPVYRWGWYGKRAAGLMMTLWPLMGSRRQARITECLRWWRAQPTVGWVNRDRTECQRGHPFDEANTYWNKGKRGCRTCRAAAQARFMERRSLGR